MKVMMVVVMVHVMHDVAMIMVHRMVIVMDHMMHVMHDVAMKHAMVMNHVMHVPNHVVMVMVVNYVVHMPNNVAHVPNVPDMMVVVMVMMHYVANVPNVPDMMVIVVMMNMMNHMSHVMVIVVMMNHMTHMTVVVMVANMMHHVVSQNVMQNVMMHKMMTMMMIMMMMHNVMMVHMSQMHQTVQNVRNDMMMQVMVHMQSMVNVQVRHVMMMMRMVNVMHVSRVQVHHVAFVPTRPVMTVASNDPSVMVDNNNVRLHMRHVVGSVQVMDHFSMMLPGHACVMPSLARMMAGTLGMVTGKPLVMPMHSLVMARSGTVVRSSPVVSMAASVRAHTRMMSMQVLMHVRAMTVVSGESAVHVMQMSVQASLAMVMISQSSVSVCVMEMAMATAVSVPSLSVMKLHPAVVMTSQATMMVVFLQMVRSFALVVQVALVKVTSERAVMTPQPRPAVPVSATHACVIVTLVLVMASQAPVQMMLSQMVSRAAPVMVSQTAMVMAETEMATSVAVAPTTRVMRTMRATAHDASDQTGRSARVTMLRLSHNGRMMVVHSLASHADNLAVANLAADDAHVHMVVRMLLLNLAADQSHHVLHLFDPLFDAVDIGLGASPVARVPQQAVGAAAAVASKMAARALFQNPAGPMAQTSVMRSGVLNLHGQLHHDVSLVPVHLGSVQGFVVAGVCATELSTHHSKHMPLAPPTFTAMAMRLVVLASLPNSLVLAMTMMQVVQLPSRPAHANLVHVRQNFHVPSHGTLEILLSALVGSLAVHGLQADAFLLSADSLVIVNLEAAHGTGLALLAAQLALNAAAATLARFVVRARLHHAQGVKLGAETGLAARHARAAVARVAAATAQAQAAMVALQVATSGTRASMNVVAVSRVNNGAGQALGLAKHLAPVVVASGSAAALPGNGQSRESRSNVMLASLAGNVRRLAAAANQGQQAHALIVHAAQRVLDEPAAAAGTATAKTSIQNVAALIQTSHQTSLTAHAASLHKATLRTSKAKLGAKLARQSKKAMLASKTTMMASMATMTTSMASVSASMTTVSASMTTMSARVAAMMTRTAGVMPAQSVMMASEMVTSTASVMTRTSSMVARPTVVVPSPTSMVASMATVSASVTGMSPSATSMVTGAPSMMPSATRMVSRKSAMTMMTTTMVMVMVMVMNMHNVGDAVSTHNLLPHVRQSTAAHVAQLAPRALVVAVASANHLANHSANHLALVPPHASMSMDNVAQGAVMRMSDMAHDATLGTHRSSGNLKREAMRRSHDASSLLEDASDLAEEPSSAAAPASAPCICLGRKQRHDEQDDGKGPQQHWAP